SRGSPVQGASVFVLDENGQPLTLFSMNGTGSDGRIRVGSLPGGRVRLLARHERLGQVEQEVWLQPGGTAETDLVLQPGCTLRILVVDQEGEPTSGIQAICFDQRGAPLSMMLQGAEAMQRGMAFLQGGEQVAGPLPPGKYRVVLTDLGAKTVSHEVVVEPGMSELRLDLAFPR
ncbi:MAG: carboxypeptidase regulatory-like domain-containing protein, partial [Planctomycetes bacterium]|nr:carboxypeptidase regulatory-like domain-containing protein [Planctomycetota bacterium]